MPKSEEKKNKLTPLMEQYWGVKSAHPDKIVFFRMGDFFEIFHTDAEVAAPILGIALTVRNKKSGDTTKMCGMPHHSIASAVNKLLKEGHKVALCDQLEDPKQAKGLVKRGITRILSPGMVFDPDTLDATSSNYIATYLDSCLGFLETSTGEVFYYQHIGESEKNRVLELLQPAELIVSEEEKEKILSSRRDMLGPHLSCFSLDMREKQNISNYTERFAGDSFPEAIQTLLAYAVYMQDDSILEGLRRAEERQFKKYMKLSPTTLRHLELFEDSRGEKRNSLFYKINRCKTSTGARLLKKWMAFPLMGQTDITKRQDLVSAWIEAESTAAENSLSPVRAKLSEMGDPERRLAKVAGPSCNPKDMNTLRDSLAAGLHISAICSAHSFPAESVVVVNDIIQNINNIIIEDAPVALNKGSYIQKGVDENLDEYFELSENAQGLLKKMEEEERSKYEIPSLKIRYNNVFGYYIEVTNTHSAKVPDHYQRKQTLTNSERYTTEELKELERKILSAKSKKDDLELEIFRNLKKQIVDNSEHILSLVDHWSEIDVLCSFAYLALERSYVRPEIHSSQELDLKASKHPSLEIDLGAMFVANDIRMHPNSSILITGPNMAGKSTVMRQVAALAILSQIGSYVPASEAKMPVFDQIFTRIGASDSLSEGLSTFMVEMTETSEILKDATEKSLVILDEIGRGTSTYDGMSLAQAILEHLIKKSKSLVLFSTHYHELTAMAADFPSLENYSMAIKEDNGEIRFQHKFQKGSASKSYGIHVAQLAGLPSAVTKRAGKILKEMELQNNGQMSLLAFADQEEDLDSYDEPSFEDSTHPFVEEFKEMRIQEMTPIDLMNKMVEWQNKLS